MAGPQRVPLVRILVVHNRYGSALPSGENRVIDDEVAALRAAGEDVETFFTDSDELRTMPLQKKAVAVTTPLTGLHSRRTLGDTLKRLRPDVVHFHNPYPMISPRLIDQCENLGIPTVATIHNFRLRCVNGLYFRDGQVCTDCAELRLPIPAVRHRCYRDSLSGSSIMAAALALHRNRWGRVTKYVAVSQYIAEHLASWGIEPSRIAVKPNPVPDPGDASEPGEGFLYAGRLSEEKGIRLLLEAWRNSGLDGDHELLIAGDGPDSQLVADAARSMRSVRQLGVVPAAEVRALRKATAVGLLTSIWYEAHPAVAESFASARPVVATNVGALATIVDDTVGWSSEPTPNALATSLSAATDRVAILARSVTARTRYETQYQPSVVVARLRQIYAEAVSSVS